MTVSEFVAGYRALRAYAPEMPQARFLLRLCGWKFGKVMALAPIVAIHARSRMRIRLNQDEHGIRSAIYLFRDRYEPSVRWAIDEFVKPGAVCFDIGANLGLWSLRMAEAAGPEGSMHAFEPHPGNAEELRGNARLSGLSTIRVHQHGLGAGETAAELFVPDDIGRASLARETAGDEAVAITLRSLDAVWDELGRPDVPFVKMDVEGAEPLVLRGGARFFATARPVICCEINPGKLANLGFVPDDVLAPLRGYGYVPRQWKAEALCECPPDRRWDRVEDIVLLPGPAPAPGLPAG